MSWNIFSIILFLLTTISTTNSYKILGVFPTTSKSHNIVGYSLGKGLANAGHDMTIMSPIPFQEPGRNYREISLHTDELLQHEVGRGVTLDEKSQNVWDFFKLLYSFSNLTTFSVLTHPNMQQFIHNPKEKFDVIICEMSLNEAMLGLGHTLQAPVIGLSPLGSYKQNNDLVGSPAPFSFVPSPFVGLSDRMTFFQRTVNTLFGIIEFAYFEFIHNGIQQDIYERIFPNPKPDLETIKRNVSLVLLNNHFTLSSTKPYVPNMIEVGGMHLNRNPKPLPQDLQDFMDNASDGVIYFSMGSLLKGNSFPKTKLNALLKVFSGLKQKILWKWEDSSLPEKPDNVYISKWFPQDDILAHPKIKFFITHGGLLSTTEAVYHGVPLIGIPFLGDQDLNMEKAVKEGYGIKVPILELNERTLSTAIDQMLYNDKYSKMARKTSTLYKDQPMAPLETAIYWVEYIARHKGAPHLRSGGQDLNFFQYHCLDVFGLLAAILALIAYTFKKISEQIFTFITSKVKKTSSKKDVQKTKKRQ